MDVAFSMPDELAERLTRRWGDLPDRAREALVAEAYRDGALSLGEVREILGHSTRMDTEQFLNSHGAHFEYSEDELIRDVQAAQEARP